MKIFSLLFAMLFSACEGDLTEYAPPPAGANSWTYAGDKSPDGHYNVGLVNTSMSCSKNLYSVRQTDWDFIEYAGNKGRLVFDSEFWWNPVDLELDNQGNFKKTETNSAFFFFASYMKQRLEISGQLDGKELEADIVFTLWFGAEPEKLAEWCVMKFKAAGKKRYQKSTVPKKLEGEYSASSEYSGTCPDKSLSEHLVVDLIPQNNGKSSIIIGSAEFYDAPMTDGKIDAKFSDGIVNYALVGKFQPEKSDLSLEIVYSSCTEKYTIAGKKRFEEAGNGEKELDGIYSSTATLTKNTCTSETYKKTAHWDVLQTALNKYLLRTGLLESQFLIQPDRRGNFYSEYDNSWYGYKSVMAGTLNPDILEATIKVHYATKNCDLVFAVKGEKLYQHN